MRKLCCVFSLLALGVEVAHSVQGLVVHPGRASAGVVVYERESVGVNVVYMERDSGNAGDAACADEGETTSKASHNHEPVRLASIKRELELMKEERREEIFRQPWFTQHQPSSLPGELASPSAVSESSASSSEEASSAEEAHLLVQATLLQQRTSALLTSLESFLESPTSAPLAAVQPHVTQYTRCLGGEHSVLVEGAPRASPSRNAGTDHAAAEQSRNNVAARVSTAYCRGPSSEGDSLATGTLPHKPFLELDDCKQRHSPEHARLECTTTANRILPTSTLSDQNPAPLRARDCVRAPAPCAECIIDVPGLQSYTETVRFLETCPSIRQLDGICGGPLPGQDHWDNHWWFRAQCSENSCSSPDSVPSPSLGQGLENSCSPRDSGPSQSMVSTLVRLALGVVVAYGESQEMRSVVKPVLSAVGKPAATSAGRVGRVGLETSRLLCDLAASASRVLGQHALAAGKAIGASVGGATVASGRAALAVGSRILCGESPMERIGVVGLTSPRRTEALYEFVGERRPDAAYRPLHPNIDSTVLEEMRGTPAIRPSSDRHLAASAPHSFLSFSDSPWPSSEHPVHPWSFSTSVQPSAIK